MIQSPVGFSWREQATYPEMLKRPPGTQKMLLTILQLAPVAATGVLD